MLDLGTGSGAMALLAAQAGAQVVAVEAHPALCQVARSNVAANGLSHLVTVVNADVASLQLGREVPHAGVNIVVFDLFDSGRAITGSFSAQSTILPRYTLVQCSAGWYLCSV